MSIKFKKPWLFAEYLDMMKTVDEAEVYNEGVNEKQSEFKKPYKHPTHPHSENEFSGPGGVGGPGGINWPTGGSWPGADCTPQGSAIGGGALNPCQPGLSCGQWAWTCAHKITKFNVAQSNGFIQSVTYGANDTVTVTVCWDESFRGAGKVVGSLVTTANGAVFNATVPLDCLGPGHDPECTNCQDCLLTTHPPVMGYATQQMSMGGAAQTLSATGGAGGPYKWKIISGGGTLSGGSGTSVMLTPPSGTNTNCTLNVTIQLTDFCGHSVTKKFAYNSSSDLTSVAFIPNEPITCTCVDVGEGGVYGCWHEQYACDNSSLGLGGHSYLNAPTLSCAVYKDTWCAQHCTTYTGGGDKRTSVMKAAGCCPAKLL